MLMYLLVNCIQILTLRFVNFVQVPKLSEGQQNAENQRALSDVVGSKKQVSYKTEIIGGVPIVTQTQVNPPIVHHRHAYILHVCS